ncbi:TPA: winged helix-turn-helix transcriptional regulator, partial [Clostridioides difficile]|nr:winged helix-turn-helix transcriptional regulator [Clostridioides difficile]
RTYNFVDNNSNQIIHNGVTLDLSTATINYEDNTIELTKNEIKILHELMKYKGQIVSRNKLMKKLWDNDWFVDDNTLTVNVNRIRSKLNEIGLEDFIETKRGLGYIIS